MASLAVLVTKPPYFTSDYLDAMEAALSAANAELEVTYIFVGDGCNQLIAGDGHRTGQKHFQKQLALLPLYDVTRIFYNQPPKDTEAIIADKVQSAEEVTKNELQQILKAANTVLVF